MPRSPFSILIVFAALTVVGFGLAPRLSLQYLPTARAPRLTVSYGWPNAAPALLEREVTTSFSFLPSATEWRIEQL